MIKHIWSVLCSNSVIDMDSHNVSLQNVVEQLHVRVGSEFKPRTLLPMPLELVTLWEKVDSDDPESSEATLLVLDPEGAKLGSFQIPVSFSEATRCRTRLRLGSILLTVSGRYTFKVSLGVSGSNVWVDVAEIPLVVTVEVDPESS